MSEARLNKDKTLLVKGTSGLGDRIKCLLTGLLYARLTDRRLIVDWSDPYFSNDGSNIFHRFFHCSLSDPADEIPLTDSVNPAVWRGHLRDSAPEMRRRYGDIDDRQVWQKFSFDLARMDYQEDLLVTCGYTLPTHLLRNCNEGPFKEFVHAGDAVIQRKLLREELTLQPDIRKQVDQFKKNYFGSSMVGVHVRYTDHRVSLWSVLKRLDGLVRQEPDVHIFLATDNLRIKTLFEDLYPCVITTPHQYASTAGMPIHVGDNRPDPTQGGIGALVDLYLLAECDRLIIDSSSSFAYVAALLTHASDGNVYDVRGKGKRRPQIKRLSHRLMLNLGMFSWGLAVLSKCARIRRAATGFKRYG